MDVSQSQSSQAKRRTYILRVGLIPPILPLLNNIKTLWIQTLQKSVQTFLQLQSIANTRKYLRKRTQQTAIPICQEHQALRIHVPDQIYHQMFESQNIFYTICVGIVVFNALVAWALLAKIPIPFYYGRMLKSMSNIHLNPRLAWFLFEVPNLVWVLYFSLAKQMPLSVGIVLFTVHYINRDIIYPCLLKTTTKVPLEIVLSAFTFTFANGYLQCVGAMRGRNGNVLMEVLGVAVFVLGMWVNIKSDRMMQAAKLKVAREEGQQSKYIVIRGFLFEYVSAPNYLGEIIEWIGYFLVVRNFESFLFMVSTFCVLTPGAIKRHQWNLQNIARYPRDRKAVIPFIV